MRKFIAYAPVALMISIAGHVQAATQADVVLKGTIIDTTCEVTANNGAATLNVGSFGKTQFTNARKQVGSEPLVVTLKNCSEDEEGALQVSGIVGSDSNVFVSHVSQPVGFMLTQDDGITQIENGSYIPVQADEDGNLRYTMNVGMAVFDSSAVEPGQYFAPIKISYINY
ncbi:TPA: type 1 fimbrial protein [Enterobacter cloacae subsp. cloacae]|nr:type 1 fimbrial protein [Enterobacter cloacae subsp. cloacae]HCM9271116.1 type 1 fimbrial protein [Enterobacter cloacae subsp. cloacae]HCM9540483.1 type 1 fimbrial protein [Enterobacter cloacae subsp. cloacae]HCM9542740.1 type 1 fimbrial protein [Enterobacter cloacae subsp. cloacae]HDC4406313.1 type 1 fimbrial protein [Enterobacter cloacae]